MAASSSRKRSKPSRDNGKTLRDLAHYVNYESPRGEFVEVTGDSPADVIAAKVATALSDAVAAVDHLKLARGQLDDIAGDETLRSQEMAHMFQRASADVSLAVKFAPVLVRRNDLTELFTTKRFLVTGDSAGKASDVVRKAQQWMKVICKDIGKDLVAARREAARVPRTEAL